MSTTTLKPAYPGLAGLIAGLSLLLARAKD